MNHSSESRNKVSAKKLICKYFSEKTIFVFEKTHKR